MSAPVRLAADRLLTALDESGRIEASDSTATALRAALRAPPQGDAPRRERVLLALEWLDDAGLRTNNPGSFAHCPWCNACRGDGHYLTCELAIALSDPPAPQGDAAPEAPAYSPHYYGPDGRGSATGTNLPCVAPRPEAPTSPPWHPEYVRGWHAARPEAAPAAVAPDTIGPALDWHPLCPPRPEAQDAPLDDLTPCVHGSLVCEPCARRAALEEGADHLWQHVARHGYADVVQRCCDALRALADAPAPAHTDPEETKP